MVTLIFFFSRVDVGSLGCPTTDLVGHKSLMRVPVGVGQVLGRGQGGTRHPSRE